MLWNQNDYENSKETFKYILDGTLYRPRDLIQIFNAIKEEFPNKEFISRDDFARAYRKRYALEKMREWEAELKASLVDYEIIKAGEGLKAFYTGDEFTISEFEDASDIGTSDSEKVLRSLYDAGMICNVAIQDNKRLYNWAFRTDDQEAALRLDYPMTVHRVIKEKYKSFWSR